MRNRIFYFIISSCILFMGCMFFVACGDSHIHKWKTEYSYDNEFHWLKCENCDKTKSRDGHYESDWILETDSTCTEEGNEYIECTVCNKRLQNRTIQKKEHDFTDWVTKSAETCTQAEVLERHCKNCSTQNMTQTGALAFGHTSSNWIIDKDKNNQETGVKHKECLTCGELIAMDYVEYSITFVTYTEDQIDNITAKFSTSITEPMNILQKQGYDFDGWYVHNGNNKYKFTFSTMPLNGATLHAEWVPHNYRINYFLNYGENDNNNPSSFTVLNEDITLEEPSKPNSIFEGWYLDEEFTQRVEVLSMPQYKDINLYAKYIDCYLVEDGIITGLTEYGKTLNKLTIPETIDGVRITKISDYAFESNIKLEEITFSNSLHEIGKYAFISCTALKQIDLPSNITVIGKYAFSNCCNVEVINYSSMVTNIENVFYETGANKEVVVNFGEILYVPSSLFYNNKYIKEINLGSTVQTISSLAFAGCLNLAVCNGGENVKNIGERAFSFCKKLTTAPIYEGLKSLDNYAFEACEKLTKIEIPTTLKNTGYAMFRGMLGLKEFVYKSNILENSNQGCSNFSNYGYGVRTEKLTVYIDKNVTRISDYFFENCPADVLYFDAENLLEYDSQKTFKDFGISSGTQVILGNNVKIVPSGFFYGNVNVTSVIVGENIESITGMFSDCFNLSYIEFNAVDCDMGESINQAAFMNSSIYNNKDLFSDVKVKVGDKVKSLYNIRWGMFRNVVELTLGKSLVSIGKWVLEDIYLEELYIPEKLSFIEFGNSGSYSIKKVIVDENNKAFTSKDTFGNELNLVRYKDRCETIILGEKFIIPSDGSVTKLSSYNYIVIDKLVIPEIITEISSYCNIKEIFTMSSVLPEWANGMSESKKIYLYSESNPLDTEYRYWHYDIDGVTPIIW